MSTLAYATLTERRELSPPRATETTEKPGVGTWVDAVAALVPAEVLGIHALALKWVTESKEGPDGKAVTTVTDPTALEILFWGGIVVAVALYLLKKKDKLEPLDALRAAIPGLAFVVWTMLQKTTAFDGAFPGMKENPRYIVGVLAAAVIAAAAKKLAVEADKEDPTPVTPPQPEPEPA